MDVLIINGHDYSKYIKMSGISWSRNDLDGSDTKRTKDGRMRRKKICAKRKINYEIFDASREILAQMDDDLSASEFEVTYRDLHGTQTRTFYCSSFSARLQWVDGDRDVWDQGAFSLIEV